MNGMNYAKKKIIRLGRGQILVKEAEEREEEAEENKSIMKDKEAEEERITISQEKSIMKDKEGAGERIIIKTKKVMEGKNAKSNTVNMMTMGMSSTPQASMRNTKENTKKKSIIMEKET